VELAFSAVLVGGTFEQGVHRGAEVLDGPCSVPGLPEQVVKPGPDQGVGRLGGVGRPASRTAGAMSFTALGTRSPLSSVLRNGPRTTSQLPSCTRNSMAAHRAAKCSCSSSPGFVLEHTWQASLSSRSAGSGCPECREHGKSRVELEYHKAAEKAFGRAASGQSVRHAAFTRRTHWLVDARPA
jgi:hypothetical protein